MKEALPFRLNAVGDISFEGPLADAPSLAPFEDIASDLTRADLVVGNLECVLTDSPSAGIPGKCVVHGGTGWAKVLKQAGIDLLSLANNHVMDYGAGGLLSTTGALRQAGVRYVGAGANRHEACSPLFLNIAGRRIAVLARSAVIVGSPCYAEEKSPGVAFLEPRDTAAAIQSARAQADIVILLIHWGIEEYSYPSSAQRQLARQLADAGADVILGHHPHVVQGIERCGHAVIAYSLGNFAFNEFGWTYTGPDGATSPQEVRLSPDNLKGLIATLEWSGAAQPTVSKTYTRIAMNGRVSADRDPARVAEMNSLSGRFGQRSYRAWWHWYALRREWSLRLQREISFRNAVTNLHRLRFRHFKSLLGSVRRSARLMMGKSTNPYD